MATSKEIKSDIELGELRNESKKPGDFVNTGASNPLIDPTFSTVITPVIWGVE